MTQRTLAASASAERALGRRLLAAMSLGAIVLVLMAAAAWGLGRRVGRHTAWVEHTYEAEAKIYRLQSLMERLETARRGYLLLQNDSFWRTYEEASVAVPQAFDALGEFVGDNPAQVANIKRLRPIVGDKLNAVAITMTLAHVGDVDLATKTFRDESPRALTAKMRAVTDAMLGEEARLLAKRSAQQQRSADRLTLVVEGGEALLAVLTVATLYLIRRYAAALSGAQGDLERMNAGLEDTVEARTAELVRANEEIQRFAYIVSHDLRSPLVNVMGFTSELEIAFQSLRKLAEAAEARAPDLVSREAREAVEQDLPEAIRFIRSSTQKMDRLINAILKLSREGRRTLMPEPVDMTALARGAADGLRSQADARGAEITVEGELPPIVSDRLAVEQVLSNLLENAVKYTAPGRPGRVVVRGRREDGALVYEVEDNGRGVDPKDHERVFELFRRAGAQDQPGEGIGLAAVRALVYRLGGRISLASELDRGATFRLSLPPTLTQAREANV